MVFWVFAVFVFIVMMAVLGVLPSFVVEQGFTILSYDMLTGLLSFLMLGLMFLVSHCAFALRFAKNFHKILIYFGLFILLIIMMAVAGVRVVNYHDNNPLLQNQKIRVSATVHIEEIGDSVYDAVHGVSYRQKAVLTDIAPIQPRQNHANTLNPLYNKQREANHQSANEVGEIANLPTKLTVLLSAYPSTKADFSSLNTLSPNSRVQMDLELSAIEPQSNVGFDSYRWLVGRHIHANAKVLFVDTDSISQEAGLLGRLQNVRYEFRQHFLQDWHDKSYEMQQAEAVTLSLLTGDRALIDKNTKELYQFAGISHLLAISGTHVLFLALMVAGAVRWLLDRWGAVCYTKIPRWQLRWLMVVGVSLVYALFTGFDVPAVRTVYMLMAVGVARFLLFDGASFRILVLVGLGMAWLDPYVLWQAGFWLSFVAVALLLRYEMDDGKAQTWMQKLTALVRLQAWLFVSMLPITMLIFGKVSWLGFVTNMVAVGLFGWVIVPINLLAGVLFIFVPSVSGVLWSGVSGLLLGLGKIFATLSLWQGQAWLIVPLSIGMAVLLMWALLPFLIPKLLPKTLSLPLLCLCAFGLMTTNKPTGARLVHLQNSQSVNAVLIYTDEMAWLTLNGGNKRLKPEVLADELLIELKKYGVRTLTGIVVQESNDTMADGVGALSLAMPIHDYWQAGADLGRRGNLHPRLCQAGRQWQGEGVSVVALTGWAELDDDKMHDCNIFVQAQSGITTETGEVRDVVLSAGVNDRLWQLWQMICQNEPDTINVPSNVGLWLGNVPTIFTSADEVQNSPVITSSNHQNYTFAQK